MLTAEERDWLNKQRNALVDASTKADVYGDALAMLHARPAPSVWNWFAWRSHKRQHTRLATTWALWSASTTRIEGVIDAWINVHNILTGHMRGPIAMRDNGSRLTKG